MQVRFLHLLVRLVGQIRPLGIGDGDQFGLIFHRGAHLLERRIRPSVECLGRAIENDSVASESDKPLRLSHWQRPQQQGVDEAECRRAGADRQSQRQDRRGGGDLVLLELPPAEDGVGAERIEPRNEPDVAALVALPQRGAECSAGFGGVASLLDRFLDVRLRALRRSRGSSDPREIHWRYATTATYQTVLRTRFTAEVTACQRDSSAASCFLPAAVSS